MANPLSDWRFLTHSVVTRLLVRGLLVPGLALAGVAGCTNKPAAKPAPAKRAPVVAAAKATRAAAKATRRKEAEAAARAKVAAMGLPPSANTLPNIRPGDITRQVLLAQIAPGENKGLSPRWMVKRIKNAAANHDKGGVQRWCTPRLRAEIDAMLPKNGERLWRHLDRYATAAAEGYEVTEQRKAEDNRLHLTIKAKGDIVLKPVLVHTAEGWRFDRF